jgi:hypothetical protein
MAGNGGKNQIPAMRARMTRRLPASRALPASTSFIVALARCVRGSWWSPRGIRRACSMSCQLGIESPVYFGDAVQGEATSFGQLADLLHDRLRRAAPDHQYPGLPRPRGLAKL